MLRLLQIIKREKNLNELNALAERLLIIDDDVLEYLKKLKNDPDEDWDELEQLYLDHLIVQIKEIKTELEKAMNK